MRLLRSVLVAAGVVALVAALVFAVVPSVAPAVTDDPFVVLAATVLGLFALGGIHRRRRRENEQAPPGEPEERRTFDHPGADVDRALAMGRLGPETRAAPHGTSLRGRVRPIALDVIARTRNCTVEEAEERLEEGTWTDDRFAAAFFSTTRAAELYASERTLDALLGRRPSRSELARRAILELAELDESAPFEYAAADQLRETREGGDGAEGSEDDAEEGLADADGFEEVVGE